MKVRNIAVAFALMCSAIFHTATAQTNAEIVKSLNLSTETASKVQAVLDERSDSLSAAYTEYDRLVRYATDSLAPGKRDHVKKSAMARLKSYLYNNHFKTEVKLAAYLTDSQIESVKDALTGGQMSEHYKGATAAQPSLTDSQKAKLRAKLRAAREYALDARDAEAVRKVFSDCLSCKAE